MSEKGVKNTDTGVEKTGTWKEITDFGEKVEEALKEASISDNSIEKFSEWRPRLEEAEADVKKKTLESATLSEQNVEKDSQGVKGDLGDASNQVAKAGKKVKDGEHPTEEIADASKKAALPFLSTVLKSFRKLEEAVYSAVMMKFNSFYLDTGELSVNVSNHNDGNYNMEVKVSGEENRGSLRDSFEEEKG